MMKEIMTIIINNKISQFVYSVGVGVAFTFSTLSYGQNVANQFTPTGVSGGGRLLSGALNPENPAHILVGCDMMGLYLTNNEGLSWKMVSSTAASGFGGNNRTEVQFAGSGVSQRIYGIRGFSWGSSRSRPAVSSDGGNTWSLIAEPSAPSEPDQYYRLFVDPSSASASTQRMVVDNYRKLWFTANGGTSWTLIHEHTGGSPGSVRLAGVSWDGSTIHVGTNLGVYVSTNGGSTWAVDTSHGGLPSGAQIVDFCGGKHPTTGVTTLFATLVQGTVEGWNYLIELDEYSSEWTYEGLYTLSVSGASSWIHRPAPGGGEFARVDVPVGNSTRPWAVTSRVNAPGIFKSSDGGQNWVATFQTAETGYAANANVSTGFQGDGGILSWLWSVPTLGLDVSDSDPDRVLVTGDFPYLTDNGGTSWMQLYVSPGTENPANTSISKPKAYQHSGLGLTTGHSLLWVNANTLLAGSTDIGLQRTTDGGDTWTTDYTPLNSGGWALEWSDWYGMAKQPGSSRIYAAVATINDMYELSRLGDEWVDSTFHKGSIVKSDDGGQSWDSLGGGVVGTLDGEFPGPVLGVAIDPSQSNVIYASSASSNDVETLQHQGGIYRSSNGGVTWHKLTNPSRTEGRPSSILVLGTNQLVTTFCARTDSTGAHTASSGVFYSNDAGATWSDRSDANMQYYTRDLVVDPVDSTRWFVAVQSTISVPDHANPTYDGRGGVYRTSASGTAWTRIWNKASVQSVTYVPGATPLLYATTSNDGLWVTANPNATTPTFVKVAGFPFARARRVFIDPYCTDGTIWVTTQGGGLWRGSVAATQLVSIKKNSGHFDFEVDVTDTGGTAPSILGITDLALSPSGWSALSGISLAVTTAPSGATRYTWTSVDSHALFSGLSGGFVRATRTRSDGTTEVSDSGGWTSETMIAGQQETWGVPWLKSQFYRGCATTVGGTLELHDSLPSAFGVGKHYYAEIAIGSSEGHRFEIDETNSTLSTVVLDLASPLNTSVSVPFINGSKIRIREHWTLDEVYDKSQFTGTNNQTTSDRIMYYEAGQYKAFWLWNNSGNPRWVSSSNASLADMGQRVIPPGEGWIIEPRGSSSRTVTASGVVRDHAFRAKYPTGLFLTSLGYPMALSCSANHFLVADGFVAAQSQNLSDRLMFLNGDSTPGATGWQSYWYLRTLTGTMIRWVKAGDSSLVDQDLALLFRKNRSFYTNLKEPKLDHIFARPWVP